MLEKISMAPRWHGEFCLCGDVPEIISWFRRYYSHKAIVKRWEPLKPGEVREFVG